MSRLRERSGSHWPLVLLAPTSAPTSLTVNHQSERGFVSYPRSIPSLHGTCFPWVTTVQSVIPCPIACLDRNATQRLRRTEASLKIVILYTTITTYARPPSIWPFSKAVHSHSLETYKYIRYDTPVTLYVNARRSWARTYATLHSLYRRLCQRTSDLLLEIHFAQRTTQHILHTHIQSCSASTRETDRSSRSRASTRWRFRRSACFCCKKRN